MVGGSVLKIHFLMNDIHGSLDLCKEAKSLLEANGESDDILDNAIAMMEILADKAGKTTLLLSSTCGCENPF